MRMHHTHKLRNRCTLQIIINKSFIFLLTRFVKEKPYCSLRGPSTTTPSTTPTPTSSTLNGSRRRTSTKSSRSPTCHSDMDQETVSVSVESNSRMPTLARILIRANVKMWKQFCLSVCHLFTLTPPNKFGYGMEIGWYPRMEITRNHHLRTLEERGERFVYEINHIRAEVINTNCVWLLVML